MAGDPLPAFLESVPTRVFAAGDPLFQQVRGLSEPAWARALAAHTAHFTFGENVGQPGCAIAAMGFIGCRRGNQSRSHGGRTCPSPPATCYTTVAVGQLRATHDGVEYGMKSKAFDDLDLWSLPERAVSPSSSWRGARRYPKDQLTGAGWRLRDAREVTRTLWTYRQYLQESRGEIGLYEARLRRCAHRMVQRAQRGLLGQRSPGLSRTTPGSAGGCRPVWESCRSRTSTRP